VPLKDRRLNQDSVDLLGVADVAEVLRYYRLRCLETSNVKALEDCVNNQNVCVCVEVCVFLTALLYAK
jgi:hypothetical protein